MWFQARRSTLDVLAQLEYHICDTYRRRGGHDLLFHRLGKGIDSAPHDGTLRKLATMHIRGPNPRLVAEFFVWENFPRSLWVPPPLRHNLYGEECRRDPSLTLSSSTSCSPTFTSLPTPTSLFMLMTLPSSAGTALRSRHKHTYRKQPLHWIAE
ncbi:hypothetical protein GWK47_052917 [Chionoecetes opilio]|uniref:Uncharacterized protein n=1 Tax=Chionoecetes opilio TaxID=41210 RepID=A0A8J5C9F3_CHIOP|nr:hypothetical protein GWK47_052917 [Chionoecetes opilio]